MPDVGPPLTPHPTHTSTQEWQSFEFRMRRRRAERCLLRAEVALDAGFEDEARAALDEARQLDWQSPDFESLQARLELRRAAEAADRASIRRRVYAAAAAFVILAAGATAVVLDQRPASAVTTPAAPPPPVVVAKAAPPTAPSSDAPVSAPDAPAVLPEAEPASIANPPTVDPREAERAVAGRPDLKVEAVEISRDPRGTSGGDVAAPPPLAVPTTAAATPGVPSNSLGTVGSISGPPAPAPAPAPADSARVPDLLPPPAPPDDSGIRALLARYESAYSSLNASAAHALWSGVDARSLERAFDSLDSQRVSLGRCTISMTGTRAQATCQGTTTWTPKVGGGTRSSARTWRFDFTNAGGSWTITNVVAR